MFVLIFHLMILVNLVTKSKIIIINVIIIERSFYQMVLLSKSDRTILLSKGLYSDLLSKGIQSCFYQIAGVQGAAAP